MATWQLFTKAKLNIANGNIDFDTDTFRILFLTAAWDPSDDQAGDHFGIAADVADVSAREVSAGYGSNGTKTYDGRPEATVPTLSEVDTDADSIVDRVDFDTENVTLSADATGFADGRYVALYREGTADSDSLLIAYADLGGDKDMTSDDLILQIDGVLRF